MNRFVPNVLDVEAIDKVVTDITEASDSMSVDDAVALRVALVSHRKDVDAAIAALDQQLVLTMELPRTHGGWMHIVRRKKDKQRFDHGAIAKVVREQAVLDDEGLMVTPRLAAEQAVDMMTDLYISDSTKAKIGALKILDIPREDVETFERGDLYVEVVPVMSEVQE